MRQAISTAWIAVIAATCSCSTYVDSTYQSYVVALRGPVQVNYDKSFDPFQQTVSYSATINYYEDAAGTIPYGSSLKPLPAAFKNFTPSMTVQYSGGQTVFPLTANGGSEALPRLSASQTSIYVQSDVYGLDMNGNHVAHARCPVQRLQLLSGSLPTTVTCQPFYGLIGRWNEIRSPTVERSQFGAAALPDGRVVIGGGLTTQGVPTSSVELFEPNVSDPSAPSQPAGVWAPAPNGAALSVARQGLTATVTTSGYVFFTGGEARNASQALVPSDVVDLFDSTQNAMLPGASPLAEARAQQSAALLSGDTVYVGAGFNFTNMAIPLYEILAPNTRTAMGPAMANDNRASPCMVTLPTEQIVVCGGSSSADSTPVTSCELVGNSGATLAGNMQLARGDAKCAAIGASVYIEGGASSGVIIPAGASPAIEQWTNGQISMIHAAPKFVTQDAAIAVGGLFLQVGGFAQGSATMPLSEGYVFNPQTTELTQLTGMSAMNNPRAAFQLVALPDGTAMAIGGLSGMPTTIVGAEIFVPN